MILLLTCVVSESKLSNYCLFSCLYNFLRDQFYNNVMFCKENTAFYVFVLRKYNQYYKLKTNKENDFTLNTEYNTSYFYLLFKIAVASMKYLKKKKKKKFG